jgi:hypothetical protein
MKLSILDLAHVPLGSDVGQALRNTLDYARHADKLGYTRFWLAEHHNMPGIASAATSVVIGQVAAVTQRIRVGAGGIMLPNHSPLVIAEQFGTLEALFPGRIDLGLGRAPGTDGLTWRALRREPSASERFPDDVLELQLLLGPVQPGQRVRAVPGADSNVRRAARREVRVAVCLRLALRACRFARRSAAVSRILQTFSAAAESLRHGWCQRDRCGHRRRGSPSLHLVAAGGDWPRNGEPGSPRAARGSHRAAVSTGAASCRRFPCLFLRGFAGHGPGGAGEVQGIHRSRRADGCQRHLRSCGTSAFAGAARHRCRVVRPAAKSKACAPGWRTYNPDSDK